MELGLQYTYAVTGVTADIWRLMATFQKHACKSNADIHPLKQTFIGEHRSYQQHTSPNMWCALGLPCPRCAFRFFRVKPCTATRLSDVWHSWREGCGVLLCPQPNTSGVPWVCPSPMPSVCLHLSSHHAAPSDRTPLYFRERVKTPRVDATEALPRQPWEDPARACATDHWQIT